ncbi:MAG: hypothetical protein QOC89_4132 [Paraburkholderia sp.]|uniref:hypothetical protein n=1 Tax=Paraburkholderia sp. TaxID=1926495 RepID=UPI002B001790|nr:hypothetical protein [Paraburkholderia sp.]MEA3086435.1 hypothetical protein [Paraburkholderia sp.]
MSNAINMVGGSMPFDMGNLPDAAQNGIQTNASFSSVRMFSPDEIGAAGNMPPAAMLHQPLAAANDGEFGTQGAGTQGGGGGADMAGALSQIMGLIGTAISAAMPLLGMVTSMMGKAGAAGGGAA